MADWILWQAIEQCEEAVARDPKFRQAWGALSVAYLRLGKHQEAVAKPSAAGRSVVTSPVCASAVGDTQ